MSTPHKGVAASEAKRSQLQERCNLNMQLEALVI